MIVKKGEIYFTDTFKLLSYAGLLDKYLSKNKGVKNTLLSYMLTDIVYKKDSNIIKRVVLVPINLDTNLIGHEIKIRYKTFIECYKEGAYLL